MSSGIIRDAYAENNQFNMTYPSSNDINASQSIGPVYGENAGTLKRIVSNTEVRIDSMTYGTCLAPAPDNSTCTGTYGGIWTGAECIASATDESSCTVAANAW